MMSLKLDTNALERLMKDDEDGQIKLELQQAVLEEFSRRHIKSIYNDGAFKAQIDNVKKEALAETEALFGKWTSSYHKKNFELNPQIKNMIQLQAKAAVTHELDAVEQHVQKLYKATAEKIQATHDKRMERINRDLQVYWDDLQKETEKMKKELITDEVDNILRDHIKSILSESFAVAN